MKKFFLFLFAIALAGGMMAQNVVNLTLDSNTHGTTYVGPGNSGMAIFDDGSVAGEYSQGHDYWMTIRSDCDSVDTTGLKHLGITIISTDIGCRDTLYIYDGPTITSPLLLKMNNCFTTDSNTHFYVGASNPTGEVTIRLRSSIHDSTEHFGGFQLSLACQFPCEYITSTIDSVFDRTNLATGEIVGHGTLKWVPAALDTLFDYRYDTLGTTVVYDTTWTSDSTYTVSQHDSLMIDTIQLDSIIRVDTLGMVWAALLCQGQGVIFHGHGNYTYNTGYYFPADSNTMFEWIIGTDVYNDYGATTTPPYNGFQDPGCPEVTLKLTDPNGCQSRIDGSIQVRISPNPIKTIFDLSSICSNDSLMVNVGYDGDNGTLTLKKIKFATTVTKTNEVRTFIPDGPQCPIPCYEAPVDFTGEFAPGKKITSAAEVCSICINYEHTFMGDYRICIRCPTFDENTSWITGQAILKFGKLGPCGTCDPDAPPDSPDGSYAGSGTNTGFPHSSNSGCDSLNNPFGIGLDYCWSRNENYTLVTGDPADLPTRYQPGNWYISYTGADQYVLRPDPGTVTLPTMASIYHNPGGGTYSGDTRLPSNHEDKTDYYLPTSDFTELVGCPLTGLWNAVICDYWSGDNGWIFNWSLDICGSVSSGDCDYQVGIDSVVWRPDTNYVTDYRDGLYKGLQIHKKWNDSTAAFISSPDTSGDFRIKLSVYDEFGCRWDEMTHITTVRTPEPNLGNDTVLCSVNSIQLDASDPYSDVHHYKYIWEPYGDTTAVINTRTGSYDTKSYIVEVSNASNNIECSARDTIVVTVNPQPVPNFDPGVYPLEGCEPFTINIDNTTTNGYKYHWIFGDGTYSTLKNPSHSYAAGSYDFKYYVESEQGCKDSLIYTNLINVYPAPKAAFSWDPVFPTVLHPSIALVNNTTPDDGSNHYFWEIQYDKNNPYSFHTLTDNNPSWTWSSASGEDVSGNYTIRLIARSDNYGPSGRLIQCADTVENSILLINDDLHFPNVVTPNGDGINDQFVIGNLVEGLAYPINQLDIYDKWGSRIFHAVNIQRHDQFWDPSKTNTPTGTYFYRFSGKGYKGNMEHNGVIEVLK